MKHVHLWHILFAMSYSFDQNQPAPVAEGDFSIPILG